MKTVCKNLFVQNCNVCDFLSSIISNEYVAVINGATIIKNVITINLFK